MKQAVMLAFLSIVVLSSSIGRGRAPANNEDGGVSVLAGVSERWHKYLSHELRAGEKPARVMEVMDGRYRDHARYRSGGEARFLDCFLLDDVHQVVFSFDGKGKLVE